MRLVVLFFIVVIGSPLFSQITKNDNLEGKPIYSKSYVEDETCFCYELTDHLLWLDYYNSLQYDAYQGFYSTQRKAIKKEIEWRSYQEFPNYEQAVKSFLKEKGAGIFANDYIHQEISSIPSEISKLKPKAQKQRDKSRLFEKLYYEINDTRIWQTFGQLQYNGKYLANFTHYEAYQLAYVDYGKAYYSTAKNIEDLTERMASLRKIRNNKDLEEYLTNRMWSDLRSLGPREEIRKVMGHLISTANPSYISTLGNVNPNNNHYIGSLADQYPLDTFVNDGIGSLLRKYKDDTANSYSSEFRFLEELKRSYSTEKENIGEETANFLGRHYRLKKISAEYMEDNNYRIGSITNVKNTITNFKNNELLVGRPYLEEGTLVGIQTQDRPDIVFRMRWGRDGLERRYGNIGRIFRELSQIKGNFNDGKTIKAALEEQYGKELSNQIDYGKLFDLNTFDGGFSIIFSPFTRANIFGGYEHLDNIYGWDLFTNPVKIEMLETLSNDGCVSFNKQSNYASCLRTWYLDQDGDGYHGEVKEAKYSPGGKWKETTLGKDCNDWDFQATSGSPITWYFDNDEDGYYFIKLQSCRKPIKPMGRWTDTPMDFEDCDDNDPEVTMSKYWYLDRDKDGYYHVKTTSCQKPTSFSGQWTTKTTGKRDCDDTDAEANTIKTWYLDNDEDGYYKLKKRSCKKPTEPSGKWTSTFLAEEDCDDNDPNKKTKGDCFNLNDPCANKDLRNKKVSEAVQRQIDQRTQFVETANNGNAIILKSFTIQDINDLLSTGDINLDSYELKITKLPNGVTAQQLFEDIRLNFFTLVTGGNSFLNQARFMSYSNEDFISWNSSNPIGSAMDFQTPLDTATVIASEYSLVEMFWTFTTVRSANHLGHPVSGHRQFRLVDNQDGTFTFQVRGADRLATPLDASVNAAFNDFAFNLADETWKNLMESVEKFVKNKPGSEVLPFDKDREYGRRHAYSVDDCKD